MDSDTRSARAVNPPPNRFAVRGTMCRFVLRIWTPRHATTTTRSCLSRGYTRKGRPNETFVFSPRVRVDVGCVTKTHRVDHPAIIGCESRHSLVSHTFRVTSQRGFFFFKNAGTRGLTRRLTVSFQTTPRGARPIPRWSNKGTTLREESLALAASANVQRRSYARVSTTRAQAVSGY